MFKNETTGPGEIEYSALEHITLLHGQKSLIKRKFEAVKGLLTNSSFSNIYAQWILSENPQKFKSNLPHNVDFREEGCEYGINLKTYFSGIPDEGIEIDIRPIHEQLKGNQDKENDNDNYSQGLIKVREFESEYNTLIKRFNDGTKQSGFLDSIKQFDELQFDDLETDVKCLETAIFDSVTYIDSIDPIDSEFNELSEEMNFHLDEIYGDLKSFEHRYNNFVNELAWYLDDDIKTKPNFKRLTKFDSVSYFVQREQINPFDVDIGNDGGCCKGIYNGEIEYTNDDLPFLMLDEATTFFGIYQKFGNKKPKRVGMVLSFASSDEQFNPVLVINSVELSAMKNPGYNEVLDPLVDHVNNYLLRFAKAAGFSWNAMGNHCYNTSLNYGSSKLDMKKPPKEKELLKLPEREHPEIYQEVFLFKDGFYSIECNKLCGDRFLVM
jgi:hypothetical protein